jgi:nitrogen fixation/metabolism regulation signal transduction histidine kinase
LVVSLEVAAIVAGAALAAGFAWGRALSFARSAEQQSQPDSKGSARAQAGDDAREKLLRAIVDNAPMAVLVYGETGKIAFSNREARLLFAEGRPLDGENFLRLLEHANESLRAGLVRKSDALFSVEGDGQIETFSLARRELELSGEPHTLLMVKELTPELGRQEVDVWKKVIRIINHELNNSLAPILSMVHTARFIAKDPEQLPKLDRVFETIEERAKHLAAFLEGYARFARLPRPRPESVSWDEFLGSVRALYPELVLGAPPAQAGYFDVGQIQQVIINLVKNAFEASPEKASVELSARTTSDGASILSVCDRGQGMTDEVLKSALVPFFTTKATGTGIGLALAREIVEAHRGRLSIARREGGGIEVSCWLPGSKAATPPHTQTLTLTRA